MSCRRERLNLETQPHRHLAVVNDQGGGERTFGECVDDYSWMWPRCHTANTIVAASEVVGVAIAEGWLSGGKQSPNSPTAELPGSRGIGKERSKNHAAGDRPPAESLV